MAKNLGRGWLKSCITKKAQVRYEEKKLNTKVENGLLSVNHSTNLEPGMIQFPVRIDLLKWFWVLKKKQIKLRKESRKIL